MSQVKSEYLGLTANKLSRIASQLKEENTELKRLCSYMHRLMDESCAVQHPYPPEPIKYIDLLEITQRMHDLGIEVSNG